MGKFDNIKVGDEVICRYFFRVSYNYGKEVMLKATVDKVTKTQFTVTVDGSKRRYRKDDGNEIGCGYSLYNKAYFEGDEIGGFDKKVAVDGTDEYLKIKERVSLMDLIQHYKRRINQTSLNTKTKLSNEELSEIVDSLRVANNNVEKASE